MNLLNPFAPSPCIHFFLFPDRSSARRVRRLVAEQRGAIGLVVGTWPELLDQARKAYLLPDPMSDWLERLTAAAADLVDVFWRDSWEAAPDETAVALASTLSMLLEGCGPFKRLRVLPEGSLSTRASRHLRDLYYLHEAMGFALPPPLSAISDVLAAGAEQAIRTINIYSCQELVRLNPWQLALIEKLNKESDGNASSLAGLYTELALPEVAGIKGTSLFSLQQGLFGEATSSDPIDDSIQCLAVRDFLEEIEVAVGMVHEALAEDPALSAADIGFLVPNEHIYLDSLRSISLQAGLPLSGIPAEKVARDLGKEAVLNFLLTRRRPVPAMALATLLSSPLMPWEADVGNELAQRIMDGCFDLEAPDEAAPNARRMLRLLRQESESAAALADSLDIFGSLLPIMEGLEGHRDRATATIEKIKVTLMKGGEVVWGDVMRLASPETLALPAPYELNREGMALFTEQEEPWRRVKQLFVLGFSTGRYPGEPSRSAVFSDADLVALNGEGAYAIETPEESSRRRRSMFLRQLACASHRINFFFPRRDCFGKEQRPSQALTYMAQLFACNDAEDLVLELERDDARVQVHGLATIPVAAPVPPRPLEKKDLSLRRDLLALHHYEDGSPKPQSPSSLDTLMASPLAWLLSRSRLQPREWAPESLDVAAKGILAHDVFEHLFRPSRPLPSAKDIRTNVPTLLNQAIIRKKPFLLGPEWHVERRHLQREVELAALRWKDLLVEMKATVLGNEVWLRGQLGTLPIHGSADLLLELPQGRLYVVDYKKASSGQRRDRMKKKYDSQASLYRLMIETGGVANTDDFLKKAFEGAQEIGVAYFMMNDQVALADSSGWMGSGVVGIEELGSGISDNALDLIRQRICELRTGAVKLNHVDDPDWYKSNAGITVYALENSPLLALFMKTDTEPGPRGLDGASPELNAEVEP